MREIKVLRSKELSLKKPASCILSAQFSGPSSMLSKSKLVTCNYNQTIAYRWTRSLELLYFRSVYTLYQSKLFLDKDDAECNARRLKKFLVPTWAKSAALRAAGFIATHFDRIICSVLLDNRRYWFPRFYVPCWSIFIPHLDWIHFIPF